MPYLLFCAELRLLAGAMTVSLFLKLGFSFSPTFLQCSCFVSCLGGSPGAPVCGKILPQCSIVKEACFPFRRVMVWLHGKRARRSQGVQKVRTATLTLSSSAIVWKLNFIAEKVAIRDAPRSVSATFSLSLTRAAILLIAICNGRKGILPIGANFTSI